MEVSKLNWDTHFFGFPIGRINIEKNKEVFNIDEFLTKVEKYKLVYIFSDCELFDIAELKLVDEKVMFHKQIENKSIDTEIADYNVEKHDYNQLLDLAYVSGVNSRFRTDENFSLYEYKKLYKKWLDKSINPETETRVLINQTNGIVTGFISIEKTEEDIATIGLLAVNSQFRGHNIASKLLANAEGLLSKESFKFLEVATQKNNLPAMKLYLKNNFRIKSKTYIHHFWNS
jgi:dTDP-4-amino-4,6-dideoxy-D-galactose acyltransferase